MAGLVKSPMGLQAIYHGAQLIDGSCYFPGMPVRWRDASALFAAGEMDRDEIYDITDRCQSFALQVKKIHEDGSLDFYSLARVKSAKLKVDGIGVHKPLEGATLGKMFARDLTKRRPKQCRLQANTDSYPCGCSSKTRSDGTFLGHSGMG